MTADAVEGLDPCKMPSRFERNSTSERRARHNSSCDYAGSGGRWRHGADTSCGSSGAGTGGSTSPRSPTKCRSRAMAGVGGEARARGRRRGIWTILAFDVRERLPRRPRHPARRCSSPAFEQIRHRGDALVSAELGGKLVEAPLDFFPTSSRLIVGRARRARTAATGTMAAAGLPWRRIRIFFFRCSAWSTTSERCALMSANERRSI